MRQLIVNVPDAQMRPLEEAARSKDMRPEALISEQLASLTSSVPGRVGVSIMRYARYALPARHGAYSMNPLPASGGEVQQTGVAYHVGIRHPGAKQIPQREPNADRTSADIERSRRREVLKRTSGIWKDRRDTPKDGVQYQQEARAEWD